MKPKILIICGVNGNGKTTSIAKLSNYYQNQGKSLMLAACDTFRAAAVEQLNVWANRLNIPLITGNQNADPASVAYKAVQEAITNNTDAMTTRIIISIITNSLIVPKIPALITSTRYVNGFR